MTETMCGNVRSSSGTGTEVWIHEELCRWDQLSTKTSCSLFCHIKLILEDIHPARYIQGYSQFPVHPWIAHVTSSYQ